MCHAPRISAILHLRRFRPSPNIRASGARQRPTRSWTTRQLAQAQCESKVAAPRRGLGRGVLNPHVALLLLRPERAHKRCKRCVCACVTHTSSIGVVARFGALKCAADRSTDLVRFAFGTRAQHAKLPLSGRAKRGTMQATAHVSRHTPTRPQLGTCTVPPKEAGGREPARTIEPPLVVCRIPGTHHRDARWDNIVSQRKCAIQRKDCAKACESMRGLATKRACACVCTHQLSKARAISTHQKDAEGHVACHSSLNEARVQVCFMSGTMGRACCTCELGDRRLSLP